MSIITRMITAATATPANTDNPVVATGLEIVFYVIVAFTLLMSLGAICGGVWVGVQQWREDQQSRLARRRGRATPT